METQEQILAETLDAVPQMEAAEVAAWVAAVARLKSEPCAKPDCAKCAGVASVWQALIARSKVLRGTA